MTLYLISLGLFSKKDISLNAIESAKKCKKLFLESYTSYYKTSKKELSNLFKKKITELKRADLENNSENIINQVKKENIGILVYGDALSATTHSSLLLDAKKLNIKTKVIHSSSILTAVAETGLSLYKFGQTTSIPFNNKNIETPYEVLKQNLKQNLHTLFLLDLNPAKKDYMNSKEAIKFMLELEAKKKQHIFTENTKIIICAALGSDKPLIKSGLVKDLLKINIKKKPQSIIVPGKLHFIEEEFVLMYKL